MPIGRRCFRCGTQAGRREPACPRCGAQLSELDEFAVWRGLRRLVDWAGLGAGTADAVRFVAQVALLAVVGIVALRLWLPAVLTAQWEQEAVALARSAFDREHQELIASGAMPAAAQTRVRVHSVEYNRGQRATVVELDWRHAVADGKETIESRCYAIIEYWGRLRALPVLCPDV
jgi:hypothetical protein